MLVTMMIFLYKNTAGSPICMYGPGHTFREMEIFFLCWKCLKSIRKFHYISPLNTWQFFNNFPYFVWSIKREARNKSFLATFNCSTVLLKPWCWCWYRLAVNLFCWNGRQSVKEFTGGISPDTLYRSSVSSSSRVVGGGRPGKWVSSLNLTCRLWSGHPGLVSGLRLTSLSILGPSTYTAVTRSMSTSGLFKAILPGNVNIEKIPGQFWITKTLPIILCSQGRKFDYFLLADFDKTSTLPSSYTRINIETWGGQISPFNIGINIFPLQGQ